MNGVYGQDTSVSVDRSITEIRRTLLRYGAEGFGFMDKRDQAMVCFVFQGTGVRMNVRLPSPDDAAFTQTGTGRSRKPGAAYQAWEQGCRQKWRALSLVIKAKLDAVTELLEGFLAFRKAIEKNTNPDSILGALAQSEKTEPQMNTEEHG